MSHTPGPHSICQIYARYDGIMRHYECSIRVGAPGVNGGQGNVIAVVYMGGPGATSNAERDIEANARLYASAPDLLTACQAALERMTGDGYEVTHFGGDVLVSLKDAIAKATGS